MNAADDITALAATVSQALAAAGIEAVLSGGAAVQIYSDAAYVSKDLDFVTAAGHRELRSVLATLGFKPGRSRRLFESADSAYLVEFPAWPLAVGDELVRSWACLRTQYGDLQILTPTQSVKDRLAAFYHWKDRQALLQAVCITRQQDNVDLAEIERWSKAEQSATGFETFKKHLEQ
ncbi:hypothetical protein [Salinisphaera japonica]|uniref:Nucleotidyltransferase family protein n=1 Tax=Salinisphaera japonica YTM-1 TaxID=1209778 RepID=A0A423Q2I1_9GAMM|nr:hypothetical protein [Salinisphaera japonica]ROO32834.1 hypothetical protein SAJA_00965 [Salinisphaera japonica YTM-1]